jgi:hypothetical protein
LKNRLAHPKLLAQTIAWVAMVFAANLMAVSPAFADQTDQTEQHLEITVNPGVAIMSATQHLAITVSGSDTITLSVNRTAINLSGVPGVLLADHLTANVITSNTDGYLLSIEAAEPRLKCVTSNDYIEPLAGAGAMADNHWGWARDDGLTPTATPNSLLWTGVASLPATIKNFAAATDPTDGDDTRIWFGTQVDWTMPPCSYAGAIVITVVANGAV